MPPRGGLSTLQSGLSKAADPVCFRWFLLLALTALPRGRGICFYSEKISSRSIVQPSRTCTGTLLPFS